MTPPLPAQRVLSTLNQDGTRHWLRPKLSRGRFLQRRRIVGYALIAVFVALPLLEIGGRQALLLDLVDRELSVFGAVFRPSDGFLLMLAGLVIVLAVFLLTALFGRVWCGWGCPQTVYLELIFRPIERLFEGTPGQQAKLPRLHWRRLAKLAVYAVLSFVLANVFLAYFVGTARLRTWVLESPLDHLGGFAVVVAVSGLMLFDFGYFREQMCIVACPYGRLQTVLLDRQSLIVGYNPQRGEPRAKPKKHLAVLGERGDCVDCNACVATCPTGIDIREGLQMECIGCAQCVDACDGVMTKLGKPRGLIGYTSEEKLAGLPARLVRARTLIYPAILAVVTGLLVWGVASKPATEISVERISGPSFIELPDGSISSQARIKIENESDSKRRYSVAIADGPDLRLRSQASWELDARASMTLPLYIDVPRASFTNGKREAYLQIADGTGFHRVIAVVLFGPAGGSP
ncbi:MAG: cytochrome c oxidase accessory protein CcoG [Kofleriaceae bacterium]